MTDTPTPVRYICQQGLCQGCPGRYEIRVQGSQVPAVRGDCGHPCHDGTPVTITTLRSN